MNKRNAAVILLEHNLDRHPEKTAYFCGDNSVSFRNLDSRSSAFTTFFREKGVMPGDRIIIVMPDCLAFPSAFLGCLKAGAVAVPVSTVMREEDYSYIIRDCSARLLITLENQETASRAAAGICPVALCDNSGLIIDSRIINGQDFPIYEPEPDDLAYMLYSSGSTGKPKGVPHRHIDLVMPCELSGKDILEISPDDVIFSVSKFSFAYGLINSLAFPLYFGATAVIHTDKPDPSEILRIIRLRKPTILFTVPSVYAQIIVYVSENSLDLPVRLCFSAGESLPSAVSDEWKKLTGIEITEGYGSTETSYIIVCNRPGEAVRGSSGRAVNGYEIRLLDDSGNEVTEGEEGNLVVRGETTARFYWNLPEKTSETMMPDGFMRTGDIFLKKGDFYYYRGRNDDMIKSAGVWVSPILVEEALRSHPAVADCAVVAVKAGPLLKPGAFVVLSMDTVYHKGLEGQLRSHVAGLLPDYMRPVQVRIVDELPRTSTGKIQRFRLRET